MTEPDDIKVLDPATAEVGHALAIAENELATTTAAILGSWNFGVDRIRTDTAHYMPEDQEALIRFFRWCTDRDHPMHRLEAARHIGYSPEMIYVLLTGKYRDPKTKELKQPPVKFMRNLRSFLATQAEEFKFVSSDFVMTPTARRIFVACELAVESKTPVILWSNSHLGKTWALKNFSVTHNHGSTFLAEIDAATGRCGLVRTMARACRVHEGKDNTDAMTERIKMAVSPETLLILDEMHLLFNTLRKDRFFTCVEVVRRIHDFRKCPLLLSWTNLQGLANSSQAELIQIWRRGVHKVALSDMPTKGNIGAILRHNGFTGEPVLDEKKKEIGLFPAKTLQIACGTGKHTIVEEPYAILRQLAKEQGLKSITERIRYAKKLARDDKSGVVWNHFVDAHIRIAKNAIPEPDWN